MSSKRKTRSSASKSKRVTRKNTKRVPLQTLDNSSNYNSQKNLQRTEDEEEHSQFQEELNKDYNKILESLLLGLPTNDVEVYVQFISKNKRSTKNKKDSIRVQKFQKGRTGKLEFIPHDGKKKTIVFDTTKHKLVQKKKTVHDAHYESIDENLLSADQEGTLSSDSSSSDKENRRANSIKNNKHPNYEVKEELSPLPQDAPGRSSKRSKRQVVYKEEERSDLEDSGNESEEDQNNLTLSPHITKSVRFSSDSVKPSNSVGLKNLQIESTWLDNEEDWRCFSAIDY